MSKERWFDCNGVELHDGDTVVDVDSGMRERVYACHPQSDPENETLGINASNEEWLKNHPFHAREIYPFANFPYKMVNGKRWLAFFKKEA